MPTLKGTEVLLSYVQCFLHLVSSSIKVSIFHITWLDTFWAALFLCVCVCVCVYASKLEFSLKISKQTRLYMLTKIFLNESLLLFFNVFQSKQLMLFSPLLVATFAIFISELSYILQYFRKLHLYS